MLAATFLPPIVILYVLDLTSSSPVKYLNWTRKIVLPFAILAVVVIGAWIRDKLSD